MPDKNVIIVGAGIAGLSAGVYAAKAGFNTIILESHIIFSCRTKILIFQMIKKIFMDI